MRFRRIWFIVLIVTGAYGQMPPSPLLNALDTNHDGAISGKEMDGAPAALRTLDKNNDGQLTRDEIRPEFGGRGEGRGGRGEQDREATGPTARELQDTL